MIFIEYQYRFFNIMIIEYKLINLLLVNNYYYYMCIYNNWKVDQYLI